MNKTEHLVDLILKSPIQNSSFKKRIVKSEKVSSLSQLAINYIKEMGYPETTQYKMAVSIAIQSEFGLGKREFNLQVISSEADEYYSSYTRLTGNEMPMSGSQVYITRLDEPYYGCILGLVTNEIENRLYSFIPENIAIMLAKKHGWEIVERGEI